MADKTVLDSDNQKVSNATVLDTDTSVQASLSLSTFRGGEIVEEFDAIGAEADVYLVEREGKQYFLKLYRKGIKVNTDILESIYLLSQKYPYFASLKEYGFDDKLGRYYELSEYLAEGNLATIDKKRIKIEPFIETMNNALHLLHQNNIIHRDLKPSNILLRSIEPQEIVLVDFGVSSVIQEDMSKVLTTFKGTYSYAAPEVMSEYFGKEVDYWSLGMVLLEILDRNPLSGLDGNVVLNVLATKNIEIPLSLGKRHRLLLQGLLTRDPKKRWGYEEVSAWLLGKSPEVHNGESEEKEDISQKYKFKDRYYSPKELARVFARGENFEDALKHIGRGYITKYLEKIEEFDEAIKLDESYSTPLEKLIYFIYSQDREMPFSLNGIVINEAYLYGLLLKYVRNELQGNDKKIFDLLSSQEIVTLVEIYKEVTGKENNLISVIDTLPVSERDIYQYFDLKLAIRQNDLQRIQKLLELKPDLDEEILMSAIESNNKEVPLLFLNSIQNNAVVTENIVTRVIQTTDKALIKKVLQLASSVTTEHYKELFRRGLGDILEKDSFNEISGEKELLQVLLEQKEYTLIEKYFDAKDLYEIAKKLLKNHNNSVELLHGLFHELKVDVDSESLGKSLLDIAIETSNDSLIDLVANYSKALQKNSNFSDYIVSTDNITLYKKYESFFADEQRLFWQALKHKSREIAKYLIGKLKIEETSLVFNLIDATDIELLRELVDNGTDLQVLNERGETPLFYSFHKKREQVAEYLLSKVDDLSSPLKDNEGHSLLWYAVKNGWYFAIDFLLNDDKYVDSLNKTDLGLETIELAIGKDDDIVISKLLTYLKLTKVSNPLLEYIIDQDSLEYFSKYENLIPSKENVLHNAVKNKSQRIASYLLLNAVPIEEETLFMAIRANLQDVIEAAMCTAKQNYEACSLFDGKGNTLLHIFAQKGWRDLFSCLLKEGDTECHNHRNNDGISYFDILVQKKDTDLLLSLAEYTFFDELSIKDEGLKELILQNDNMRLYTAYQKKITDKYDLLYQAIKKKRERLSTAILKEDIGVDSRLLFLAIATDQLEIVKLLAEKSVDLNAIGKYGDTPIQYAILKDRKEIAEYLLNKNVNVDVLNKDGNSLLHLAMLKGWYGVIEKLCKRIPVEKKNLAGETPLLTYLKHSRAVSKSIIDLLLENGARIDAIDNEGTSVEDLAKNAVSILQAAKNRDESRVELLLERGGDINKALHDFIDEYIVEKDRMSK